MSYIIESKGYVYPHEIDARIAELAEEIPVASLDEWRGELAGELAELRAFKEAVIGRVGDWQRATIVPVADFEDHARDYAEDHVEGLDLVSAFVNWEAFARYLISDYAKVVTPDGDLYLVR